MTTIQRRRWERHRIALDVTVSAADGSVAGVCVTTDVCEGGLGLRSAVALDAGAVYRFSIPALAAQPLGGIVRWCTPTADGAEFMLGIELEAASARQSEEIAEAIASWRADSAADA